MHGYRPGTYGASFADVYDDWYADVSDVDATVAAIRRLAAEGSVLELGVGTGRLAVPLAAAGVRVVGVDAAPEMLRRLRAKPGGPAVAAVLADMATLPLPDGSVDIAFAAFNTLFNLADDAAQRRCLAEVARVLRPSGRLAVEAFVPPEQGMPDGGVSVRDVTLDSAVLSVTRHDAAGQVVHGQHVEISENGIRMRPWVLRYLSPDQLDERARAAGLALESRHADWERSPWSAETSETHVSVYRRDPGGEHTAAT